MDDVDREDAWKLVICEYFEGLFSKHKFFERADFLISLDDGKQFKVHSNVVWMFSDYFGNLVSTDMKEGSRKEISFPGKDPILIKFVFLCCYVQTVNNLMKDHRILLDVIPDLFVIQEVMKITHEWQIKDNYMVSCNRIMCDYLKSGHVRGIEDIDFSVYDLLGSAAKYDLIELLDSKDLLERIDGCNNTSFLKDINRHIFKKIKKLQVRDYFKKFLLFAASLRCLQEDSGEARNTGKSYREARQEAQDGRQQDRILVIDLLCAV